MHPTINFNNNQKIFKLFMLKSISKLIPNMMNSTNSISFDFYYLIAGN